MVISGLLTAALVVAAWATGAGTIETYPQISGGFEPETLAFALLIPLVTALPFLAPAQLRRLRAEARR